MSKSICKTLEKAIARQQRGGDHKGMSKLMDTPKPELPDGMAVEWE